MLNEVKLIGNLGADPEVRSAGGKKVVKLRVATEKSYKNQSGEWISKTEWHTVIAWSYEADKAEKFKKGDLVYVGGELNTRKWQTNSGEDRYSTEIVANRTYSLMPKPKSDHPMAAGTNGTHNPFNR